MLKLTLKNLVKNCRICICPIIFFIPFGNILICECRKGLKLNSGMLEQLQTLWALERKVKSSELITDSNTGDTECNSN